MFSNVTKKNFISVVKSYADSVIDGYTLLFYNSYNIDETVKSLIEISMVEAGYETFYINDFIIKLNEWIKESVNTGKDVDIKSRIEKYFDEYENSLLKETFEEE